MDDATRELLRIAAAEIRELRRRNEVLDAKVSTMELFATVLNTRPNYGSQGEAEDIAWKIDRAVDRHDEGVSAAVKAHQAEYGPTPQFMAMGQMDQAAAQEAADPLAAQIARAARDAGEEPLINYRRARAHAHAERAAEEYAARAERFQAEADRRAALQEEGR